MRGPEGMLGEGERKREGRPRDGERDVLRFCFCFSFWESKLGGFRSFVR